MLRDRLEWEYSWDVSYHYESAIWERFRMSLCKTSSSEEFVDECESVPDNTLWANISVHQRLKSWTADGTLMER
jgi:hypothetical protein